VSCSERALDALDRAPAAVRKALGKQVSLLCENLHHPSLRTKKYGGVEEIWQARVNRDWRFYFVIERDTIHITNVIPHPK
jgi:mRNA-degrading endonuclease RelE of RelBE toxin-antitoxin system